MTTDTLPGSPHMPPGFTESFVSTRQPPPEQPAYQRLMQSPGGWVSVWEYVADWVGETPPNIRARLLGMIEGDDILGPDFEQFVEEQEASL